MIKRLSRSNTLKFYLLVSPWLVGFVVFVAGPMVYSMYLSMTRYTMLNPPSWIGLANYTNLLRDARFLKSLRVTATYNFVGVPLRLIFAFAIALMLNNIRRGKDFIRTVYYLPSVVSGVAVVVLWRWLFNPEVGLVNHILGWFGIQGPGWLYDPDWALPALIIMSLWGVGRDVVIFLAGLQGIGVQLYEAARIDGAGGWQCLRYITVPMISPTIFFNLVMGIIGSFQVFTDAYVATQGGPMDATLVTVLYLYLQAFGNLRMGYASAIAWVLFVIIMFFTLLIIRSSTVWVFYETEIGGKKA